MNRAADLFVVPRTTRCPAALEESSDLSQTVCHQHIKVQRITILIWTAVSTFLSLIVGLVLTWIHDNTWWAALHGPSPRS